MAIPVGLLVLQIVLVNVFVRQLQDAVVFISKTHETIEDAFVASELIDQLRGEVKRLPASFVADRAAGDEGLSAFETIFGTLAIRIQSIQNSEAGSSAPESLDELNQTFGKVRTDLDTSRTALLADAIDMNLLLQQALVLDGALDDLAIALDNLTGDLRVQLQLAVDQERRIHNRPVVAGIAIGALSVAMLLVFTWLVLDRFFVSRLTGLSKVMLAIAGGNLKAVLPEPKGNDEVDEMTRTVETFRVTANERDRLLIERERAAERLEQEVKDRTAELEDANAFKTRFLASASHDLRQPLHALNLFIEQLGVASSAEERERLQCQVSESAGAINDLLNALLDMSKLEAGVLEPEISEIPISAVLDRLESTFAATADQKQLQFRVMPSTAWVKSDAILLERILLNLVSNALNATQKGGVIIGCRPRGDTIRIDVCDTGPGIPTELQGEFFKELVQFSSSPKRRDSLRPGLSIVVGLAKLLGHPIKLHSIEGQGTRISITLPKAAATKSDEKPSATPILQDSLSGRTILVVDDDDRVRESMAGMLGSWGCNVMLAATITDAVKIAGLGDCPDLIISDYRLAQSETGVDAILSVRRALGQEIPAFLITAETLEKTLDDVVAHGFEILQKPVAPMALRAMASQFLTLA
ncbi:MAG: ATP-binding protein [Paracoccaceae bacterium]